MSRFPRTLTLPQALAVAAAIDGAKTSLAIAMADTLDRDVHDELHGIYRGLATHQADLEDLVRDLVPATVQQVDDRACFLIRQALDAGEGMEEIAAIAQSAHAQMAVVRLHQEPAAGSA